MSDRSATAAPARSPRIKLRDVARVAGVSVATVSRVINGSSKVAPDTRRLIDETIHDLGYAPNPLAKALNAGRTRAVGAIVPTLDHAIFASYLNALEETLGARGLALIVATSRGDPEIEGARARALLEMGAEALILSGADPRPELSALAARFAVPIVLSSVHDPEAAHPTIGYDNAGLAKAAIRYLHGLGHTGIVLIHGPTADNDRTRMRIAGARAAAKALGASLKLVPTELSEAGGADAARRVLAEGLDATAFLCLTDVIALGALFELRRGGIGVPEDVSLMGFDNIAWSEHTLPSLTTIDLSVAEMGVKVAETLADRLDLDIPIRPALLPGRIVPRQSTRAVEG